MGNQTFEAIKFNEENLFISEITLLRAMNLKK